MEGSTTYKSIDQMVAYRKALNTWENWENPQVDFKKSMVFFSTMAPHHSRLVILYDIYF